MDKCMYCKYQKFIRSEYLCLLKNKILKKNEKGKLYTICEDR